ncbi:MAG: proline dehydrogenase family protein [Bacteroidia bacterium]
MLDFQNTELAFQAKSNAELRKSYYLFTMISLPVLADVGPRLMSWAFEWNLPVQGIVKNTLFQQFCGGVSIEGTVKSSDALYRFGVKTILDYSVEGEKSEKGFDETMQEIVQTLVHGGQQEAVAFTACKLTGLGEFDLLDKMSRLGAISEEEQQAFARVKTRLTNICQAALDNDTPVFIDAEESWIQAAIDALAEEMMEKYNQKRPLVYTTVQLYRHDRLAYLEGLIQRSKEKGYFLGVKLVRGAYMEKENARAEKLGYATPIQPNKAATDKDYDAALKLCAEHIETVAICAGSHNERSAMYLTELMQQKKLPANHAHILFAQLFGMSDHISFNLAHEQYNVAKYLPYGPVKAVMPYLMRRAQENTAIKGEAGRELKLLKTEMKRRFK